MDYKQIIATLLDMENDDENIERLQEAMEYFCGTWDKCGGYKHALILTLQDQYENHPEDQDPQDLIKLKEILTK